MSGGRRILAVALFLAILLSVVVGGHLYLVRRLVLDLGLSAALESAGIALFVALGAALFLQPIAERLLPRPRRTRSWRARPRRSSRIR